MNVVISIPIILDLIKIKYNNKRDWHNITIKMYNIFAKKITCALNVLYKMYKSNIITIEVLIIMGGHQFIGLKSE